MHFGTCLYAAFLYSKSFQQIICSENMGHRFQKFQNIVIFLLKESTSYAFFMVSITGLTHYIGGKALYEDASCFIKTNGKVGLVGLNGTGKSTLFKIITGDINPEQGKINKGVGCTIGFLNQDMLSYVTEKTILGVAMEAFSEVTEIQERMDKVIEEMEHNYSERLLEELSELQENFEKRGGYEVQSKAEKVLEGIGFSTKDLSRPMSEFSGGWRMRVWLAKLLLERPSLLMLDEPTNHLDIIAIQWLEGYLTSYPGAVMVISHDRRFLDAVTNTTVEVSQRKLHTYAGNYSFYEHEKAEREVLQQRAYVNQQKKIKKTEEFINRFRAKSSKASQVQSTIKKLAKMDRVEEVASAPSSMKLRFRLSRASGKEVVVLEEIGKRYEDLELFDKTSVQINRGDHIALIGANGKGKTTLLKLLAGEEAPSEGKVVFGHHADEVFYAQHQVEALNVENTIFEEMEEAHPDCSHADIRRVLGALLFVKDDVKKKIKVLSGGEKARVALAKVILSGANFLILDEPTNHLDMISIDILMHALQSYEGTFILVSHNRYFIERVANKIWYIEDKKVKAFEGNYEAYEFWQKKRGS